MRNAMLGNKVAAMLLFACNGLGMATIPTPTAPQLWYQESGLVALIHFNMATFIRDGDPGCDATNWAAVAQGAAGPSGEAKTFNPAKLDFQKWADVMKAVGIKSAVLTAKHGCGHLLWPTNTTLPNGAPYEYNVGSSSAAIKRDILKEFAQTMKNNNLKHGFYYSLTNNFYLNVGDHNAHAHSNLAPGQQNVTQSQFEAIALAQVTELWKNYGDLGEIWFDGGYTTDMKAQLQKLLAVHQPNAVGFNGLGISANPIGWIGTESGHPDCPDGVWSLVSNSNVNCGDPSGTIFQPKTCDTTLQNNDRWFWTPPAASVRSLEELQQVFHDTLGSNGVIELDFAIDRDGLVNPVHEARYREFGSWIKACYGKDEKALISLPQKMPDGRWRVNATLYVPRSVDRIVLAEDLAFGQNIRSGTYVACSSVDGCDLSGIVANFTAVGSKKISLLEAPLPAMTFRIIALIATIDGNAPRIKDFSPLTGDGC